MGTSNGIKKIGLTIIIVIIVAFAIYLISVGPAGERNAIQNIKGPVEVNIGVDLEGIGDLGSEIREELENIANSVSNKEEFEVDVSLDVADQTSEGIE